MQLVRGFSDLKTPATGSAVTIGNFDGLHLGHQALVNRVIADAERDGSVSTVLLFEPHPREFFAPRKAPGRILELRGKLDVLETLGVERVVCLPFGRRLASMPAGVFIRRVLVQGLRTRSLVVGDDFRFGAGRKGNTALLRAEGARFGFSVEGVGTVEVGGARVSSTRVRLALAEADLVLAEELLGRPYVICGRVRHGLELGRKLDMPTANLPLRYPPALRHGIYAVRVQIQNGEREIPGVASLGVRPTLNMNECVLEDHLFEPPGDLYGKVLKTRFVRFMRGQEKFETLDALQAQMRADAERARALLKP